MGVYVYGISKRIKHPEHGKVGVLKYLYKPCSNWDLNDKWDRMYCNLIRYRWKKDPVRIVCYEGHPDTLYYYRGGDGIWQDHREDLLVPYGHKRFVCIYKRSEDGSEVKRYVFAADYNAALDMAEAWDRPHLVLWSVDDAPLD